MEEATMIFQNVPVDPDTRILHQKEITIDTLPVLIQAWAWEGIVAESAIFRAEDVRGFSDEELFQKIVDNLDFGPDHRHTITRDSDGYTFVNFNFQQ